MMAPKLRGSGCSVKEQGKRLISITIRAGTIDHRRVGSWNMFDSKRASCIFCIVESLHEVAMDNNDMHGIWCKQRGS